MEEQGAKRPPFLPLSNIQGFISVQAKQTIKIKLTFKSLALSWESFLVIHHSSIIAHTALNFEIHMFKERKQLKELSLDTMECCPKIFHR